MKEDKGQHVPLARKDGLIIRELPDEVLVYDLDRDKAHCLNQTAALVWEQCDGRTPVAEIARRLEKQLKAPVSKEMVWFALDQLGRDHLLEERIAAPAMFTGMSRRQMVRHLALGAVVAVPLVTSIIAPTPAQAATCLPSGSACSAVVQCCTFCCTNAAAGCKVNTCV